MKLLIRNFRSIKSQEIELAPITVVYGPNGAGKSSLLYSLLTFKNVVLNPTQNSNDFFNYAFTNLGGFEAIVFDHQMRNGIELELALEIEGYSLLYRVAIEERQGSFTLTGRHATAEFNLHLPVTFPYPANQEAQARLVSEHTTFIIDWNGIIARVNIEGTDGTILAEADMLASRLNSFAEFARQMGIVPLKRGFSKPFYSSGIVSPMIANEDEIASLLSNDKYLVSKVSHYLEQTLERDFRVNFKPGTASFSLDATDKRTGIASDLVNEGFGVNQLVYLLARSLHRDTGWVCIEEPEIHLHPTAVRKLTKTLVQITRDEGKHFIVSTHSETFIMALLTLVARGEVNPSEIACYLTMKDGKETRFERQSVNQDGQLEGGLTSFMAGEMEDIAAFLGTSK